MHDLVGSLLSRLCRRNACLHLRRNGNGCGDLPGLDCGSCGAPTCMAFAEDIVKGETNADECTVTMRMIFHDYLLKRREAHEINPLKKWMAPEWQTHAENLPDAENAEGDGKGEDA